MDNQFLVTSSPHFRSEFKIERIMLDVVIALIPALIAGTIFFGMRALLLTIISVAAAVLTEYVIEVLLHKEITIDDFSAVVTGMLVAFNVPPTVSWWIPAVGSFFAIAIVKMCFGGIGNNFVNPALAARAFLLASWPVQMTTWAVPGAVDGVSSATPLAILKGTEVAGAQLPNLWTMFVGNIGGTIGETSALALLIGAAYLLYRKVINLRIPLSFIITVGVMTWIFGPNGMFTGPFLYHILGGGLILGAFFMATDYPTSPVTPLGQVIMGIGCGLLTSVIRLWGGYPEGVSYSILLMNMVTPLIDRYTMPRVFGTREVKKVA
ncbi:MAG: RnfABCDGE type electron transport complex subunit D [Thermoanaerobacteraceae bacterium]|nr:RnfABCDGE type electron transport complex subunit D [Thermoanaerobacteraceae bacterium]